MEVNTTRTPWVSPGVFSSQPTQNRNHVSCQNPTLSDYGPLVPKTPQNRRGRRPPSSETHECTVDHAHNDLHPPLDETNPRLTTGLTLHLRLSVATYGDSPTCAGVPGHRRHRVMVEVNRSMTPVRAPEGGTLSGHKKKKGHR